MARWTRAHLRHIGRLLHQGKRPAVAVYESIGSDFFLAPAPGWLNLGWWDGPGDEAEASRAPERLVEMLAADLPRDGVIVDVANGLGAQDTVIARLARPSRLIAVNLTEFQLRAGRERLRSAGAEPVVGDAVHLPVADASADGVISVEAAFHFPSRARFLAEAHRVLRPGGMLSMSDVTAERMPRRIGEAFAGLAQLRLWGMRRRMLASAGQIAAMAEEAGFSDVRVTLCAGRTIDPALRWARARLATADAPRLQRWAAGLGLRQVELLRRRGMVQYVLLRARA